MRVQRLVEGKLVDCELQGEPDPQILQMWSKFTQRHPKFSKPTLIQERVWSAPCNSLIFMAPTGSGKTYAYGMRLNDKGALILVPTRELATQVKERLQAIDPIRPMHAFCGGTPMYTHDIALHSIVIGTPGRLVEMAPRHKFFTQIHTVVLDEADKLTLSKDLLPQVTQLLQVTSSRNATILCSATMPNEVLSTWSTWTKHNATVIVPDESSSQQQRSTIPANITQTLHVCAEHKKPRKLIQTLQKCTGITIVFVNKIVKLDHLRKLLPTATVLHSQIQERQKALNLIKSGRSKVLLATDLVARGIDIPNIQFIINYDFPTNLETYVHRCGRAGRDGRQGTVFSFFTRNLKPMVNDLIQLLRDHKQWVDPNLVALLDENAKEKSLPNKRPKANDENESDDEFAGLSAKRIVLRRASNVSDASSSSDSDD